VTARRVVITGSGLVNPLGVQAATVLQALLEGRSGIAALDDDCPVRLAAQVPSNVKLGGAVSRRHLSKTDRFTHLALAAAQYAIDDAALNLDSEDRFRVGVWLGNATGGWDVYHRGLDELFTEGPDMVNSYLATSWFLTAAQSWVGIRHDLHGHSKSFACDRASGASAIAHAVRSIRWGRNDVTLAGGTEAPLDVLGRVCLLSTGELTPCHDAARAYRPFDVDRSGHVLGEGAAIVVLEAAEHAEGRDARILAEISSVAEAAGAADDPDPQVQAIEAALADADLEPSALDLVVAEGCGTRMGDHVESQALVRALGRGVVPVTTTKAAYGHLYGAAFPTELVLALAMMQRGVVPAVPHLEHPDVAGTLDLVAAPRGADLRSVLVTATSRGGTAVALVVRRRGEGP
jgi:3-oxoacyl-[acyl-carrier-protein] synthase II